MCIYVELVEPILHLNCTKYVVKKALYCLRIIAKLKNKNKLSKLFEENIAC